MNTNINLLYLRDVISTESNVVVAFERFKARLKLFWFYSKADAWLCFFALASPPEPLILCWIGASGFMHLAHRISICFFPELWWMSDTTQAQMENGVKPGSGWQIGGIQGHIFCKTCSQNLVLSKSYTLCKRRVGLCSFRSSGHLLYRMVERRRTVLIGNDHCERSRFSGNRPKIKSFTVILLRTTMEEEDVQCVYTSCSFKQLELCRLSLNARDSARCLFQEENFG